MKTVAIIQARYGSTRLPGKILLPILDRPLLAHLIERVKRIKGIDQIVVATTMEKEARRIVDLVHSLDDVGCFQGSEEDVLERFFASAQEFEAEALVRITSDCPLLDPDVSSRTVEIFQTHSPHYDYVSNCRERTFPRGLDTEVFSFSALKIAHREATEKSDREHVTPFIWKNNARFSFFNHTDSINNSALRWTVDTPEDYRFVCQVYGHLYPQNPSFGYPEILRLLKDKPELLKINAHVQQKEIA